jgi:hypothetical protein
MPYPFEASSAPESLETPAIGTPPWLDADEDSLAPVSPHDIINARRAQLENAEALRRARAL